MQTSLHSECQSGGGQLKPSIKQNALSPLVSDQRDRNANY